MIYSRPLLKLPISKCRTDFNNIKELAMPAFPLDLVREIVMSGLEEAVRVNQVHNRDPIGGSNEDLFV